MDHEGEPTAQASRPSPIVASLTTSGVRNLAAEAVALDPRLTLIWGSNGAGKSSLLEALCLALSGRSPRTPRQREAIAHEAELARSEAVVEAGRRQRRFLWSATRAGERRHLLDGKPAGRDAAGARPPLIAFFPDRLALVKGGPGPRRAHLDRLGEALWPARAGVRDRYRRALAQRNALLAALRGSDPPALDAWDRELALTGTELIAMRREATERLREHVAGTGAELDAGALSIEYRPRSEAASAEELAAELRARRAADIGRGFSGHGPHLDEIELRLDRRSVRRYASQGEQRAALLALLLAERTLLLEARDRAPLMLLDDVLSELDPERRERLTARLIEAEGQALVAATEPGQLPASAERLEIALDRGRLVRPRLERRDAA
jgi:DNA replication and repair protein RecF